MSKISPIFKKDNTQDPACYLPILQLTSFSKVYERLVHNQFTTFLEPICQLDKEQHGFRPIRYVITNATDLIQSIIDNTDKMIVAALYLVLSRAFNSVQSCCKS